MFRIRLVLDRQPDVWVFRVGRGFRLVSLATAAGLIWAGALLESFTASAVLAALALLGSLYEETARFDRARGRVEFRWGLVFLHRTRSFAVDQVAEVRTVGFGAARFSGLEVGLRDGTVLTIENERGKTGSERLRGWGAELAQWLGVPLVMSAG